MTITLFESTRFGAGMKCIYNKEEYSIKSVDFIECLIEIYKTDSEDTYWCRCENIELIN